MYKKFLILLLVVFSLQLNGITNSTQHHVKSAFIEKFTRFIDWPEDDIKRKNPKFVIGVVGNTLITTYLYELSKNRKIKGKKVIVKVLDDYDEIYRCQIIFISRESRNQVSHIVNRTRNMPILTISESRGSARKGILINFYLHKNCVRFEINDMAVKRSGLKFSSKLLKLAKIVR